MTTDPADLPAVDQVIHDAREVAWHDPTATVAPAATAPAHGAPAAHAAHAAPAHDDHEAEHGDSLGPVDTAQWAAGAIGVVVGLAVAACFVLATQGLGAY